MLKRVLKLHQQLNLLLDKKQNPLDQPDRRKLLGMLLPLLLMLLVVLKLLDLLDQ